MIQNPDAAVDTDGKLPPAMIEAQREYDLFHAPQQTGPTAGGEESPGWQKDLFGKSYVEGGKASPIGGLFAEGAATTKAPQSAEEARIAKQYDPMATPELPLHEASEDNPLEDTLPPIPHGEIEPPFGLEDISNMSRREMEDRLLAAHEPERTARNDYLQDQWNRLESTGANSAPFTFYKEYPAEIRQYLKEDNPAARKFFRLTNDPQAASGADAFGELGDKYFQYADMLTGNDKRPNQLRDALVYAQNHPDPTLNAIQERYDDLVNPKTGLHPVLGARLRRGFVAVPNAVTNLVDRDLGPAMEKLGSGVAGGWRATNRLLGTGVGWSPAEKASALDIRQMLGEGKMLAARVEKFISPWRQQFEAMPQGSRDQWIDAVEHGQPSPDPNLQPFADWWRSQVGSMIPEAQKYGINNARGWSNDWIGRMFKPDPSRTPSGQSGSTIAGRQGFLLPQDYDTWSDAKAAAAKIGFIPTHDNPADMMLGKLLEVRRSIDARKLMYDGEDKGTLKWTPDNERPPTGYTSVPKDKLATQERPLYAPRQTVYLANQMSPPDAARFLDSKKAEMIAVRPGDPIPQTTLKSGAKSDYAYTGRRQPGQFYTSPNVAAQFDSLLPPDLGEARDLGKIGVAIKRAATAANYMFGLFHPAWVATGNAGIQLGEALNNAAHADFGAAIENAKLANPYSAFKWGKQLRQVYTDPSSGTPAQRAIVEQMAKSNPGKMRIGQSALDPNLFKDAGKEWDAGNPIGAAARVAKGSLQAINKPIFDKLVPNMEAAALGSVAAREIRNGTPPDQMRENIAKAQSMVQNVMGSTVRSNNFQNHHVQLMKDLVASVPNFLEGQIRFAANVAGDTAKNLAGGKITSNQLTAVGLLAQHALLASTIQAIYTAAHGNLQLPSSLMDIWKPRTGEKDADGRDIRIQIPDYLGLWSSLAQRPVNALYNRLTPLIRGPAETIANKDRQGMQVHDPDDNAIQELGAGLRHTAAVAAPTIAQSITNPVGGEKPTPDQVVARIFGFRPQKDYSDAEELAMQKMYPEPQPGKTQDQADLSSLRHSLIDAVKQNHDDGVAKVRQAIVDGKMTPQQGRNTIRWASEPNGLVGWIGRSDFAGGGYQGMRSALDVYDAGSDVEKKELAPVLTQKFAKLKLTPSQRQELAARVPAAQ